MAAEIKNLKDLQNTEYSLKKLFDEAEDFLPLLGTDYVELYVGNAKQSAHFYKTAFGFQSEAYAGLVADAVESTGASSMRDMGAVMAKLEEFMATTQAHLARLEARMDAFETKFASSAAGTTATVPCPR